MVFVPMLPHTEFGRKKTIQYTHSTLFAVIIAKVKITVRQPKYRFMIQQENMKVCKYEDNEGQIILDKHIYSMSARHKKMMRKKGHLVLRILENRLTSILLLQVISRPKFNFGPDRFHFRWSRHSDTSLMNPP